MGVDLEKLNRMGLEPRMAVHGRIRLGKKGDKGQPVKLKTLRFTSSDRVALEAVADIYGGTVTEWVEPKAGDGQCEVITETTKVRIALPPDPLGGTPIMEQWTGGGCVRRCDAGDPNLEGQQGCTVAGAEGFVQVACLCLSEGFWSCKPITRLTVLLPEVNFGGGWRLDTGSVNAAKELPAMVAMLEHAQSKGLPGGWLHTEERRTVADGRTHRYMVPKITLDINFEGETAVALPEPAIAALESGELTDDLWAEFRFVCAQLNDEGKKRVEAKAAELGRSSLKRGDLDAVTVVALIEWAEDMWSMYPSEEEDGDR